MNFAHVRKVLAFISTVYTPAPKLRATKLCVYGAFCLGVFRSHIRRGSICGVNF